MGAPERVIGGWFEVLERVGKGSFGEEQACVERINLGHVCAELGDLDRAEEVLSTCHSAAQRMRLGTVQAACHLNLARVLSRAAGPRRGLVGGGGERGSAGGD